MMRRVNNTYNEMREDVGKVLKKITNFYITTDAWTSLVTQSYITFTAHFVENNWDINTNTLDTSDLGDKYSAEI